MKFYYSSMYVHGSLQSIENLDKTMELYLDANICIYLGQFYKEPSSIIHNTDLWNELREFFKYIDLYNLPVDFSLGVAEACRSLNNFEVNHEKLADMHGSILSLLMMNYYEILQHSKLIKFDTFVKDFSPKQNTKLESLESSSELFQSSLFVNYACLLKMRVLEKNRGSRSNVDLMIEFLDFVDQQVDCFHTSVVIFAYYYFSGHHQMKKLIHKAKNTEEEQLHAIWNAAIDLVFPRQLPPQITKKETIPVFVTADERLWIIFESMKMPYAIEDDGAIPLFPLYQLELSRTKWTAHELKRITEYYRQIMQRRTDKIIRSTSNQITLIEKLRVLCFSLEKELKKYISNSA